MSDEGQYSCLINNSLGSEKGHSRLKVLPAHPLGGSNTEPTHTTTGVIVIAVVICIVGTSVVWVAIIYHTRKRTPGPHSTRYVGPPRGPSPGVRIPEAVAIGPRGGSGKSAGRVLAMDAHSGVSKDSGQQSSDDLLMEEGSRLLLPNLTDRAGRLCPPSERHPLLHRLARSLEQLEPAPPLLPSDFCSTLPRSVTLAGVSQWSDHSPRFRRLPRDIPNDSGSFSMAGDDPITATPCGVRATATSNFPCLPSPLKT